MATKQVRCHDYPQDAACTGSSHHHVRVQFLLENIRQVMLPDAASNLSTLKRKINQAFSYFPAIVLQLCREQQQYANHRNALNWCQTRGSRGCVCLYVCMYVFLPATLPGSVVLDEGCVTPSSSSSSGSTYCSASRVAPHCPYQAPQQLTMIQFILFTDSPIHPYEQAHKTDSIRCL